MVGALLARIYLSNRARSFGAVLLPQGKTAPLPVLGRKRESMDESR